MTIERKQKHPTLSHNNAYNIRLIESRIMAIIANPTEDSYEYMICLGSQICYG